MTSSYTRAQTIALYDDSLSYDTDNSPSKAHQFVEACRAMLNPGRWVDEVDHGSAERLKALPPELLMKLITSAQRWLVLNENAARSVRHPSFSGFRE